MHGKHQRYESRRRHTVKLVLATMLLPTVASFVAVTGEVLDDIAARQPSTPTEQAVIDHADADRLIALQFSMYGILTIEGAALAIHDRRRQQRIGATAVSVPVPQETELGNLSLTEGDINSVDQII